MPVHNVGYRRWQGRLTPLSARWLVIAETGIRLAWKSQWLRRMLFLAWMPAATAGFAFFMYEQIIEREQQGMSLQQMGMVRAMNETLERLGVSGRHDVWALILLYFFRHPQGVLMTLVVGLVAPTLIARDLRSRAFLLYFSRPIRPLEYILGKACVVWCYLALITTLPALALYVLGVLLSPDLNVVASTWDLPLRILVASAVLMIPTTALALLYSAMPYESRYAGFAWFATLVMGIVAYSALSVNGSARDWTVVSLYHMLGRVQSWIFGLETDFNRVSPSLVILATITVLGTFVLHARIVHQTRT